MTLVRKLFIPVVIANNLRYFASFKKLHNCKYDSKLLLRKIVALKQNALQCAYSTSFQDLFFQTDISFNNLKIQKHIEFLLKQFNEAEEKLNNSSHEVKDLKEIFYGLQPLVVLKSERDKLMKQVEELDLFISDLKKQKDEELLSVAQQERETLSNHIHHCEMGMLERLVPERHEDEKDIILELSAGVGGQEAMLFTKDIFDMYCRFAAYKRWDVDIIKFDETGLGGIRNAHVSINGLNAYKLLKFESGVHRVQRVPKTEKGGRIHTSTMTVAVLPQPTEIDIALNRSEINMVFKNSSGAGGQHVNTTDSCVRLTHVPTGITVECQVSRDQHRNRALALMSLRARLYQKKLSETTQETSSSRKLQVGTAARSDKVRTYNYLQDRITDHRVHKNMYNIEVFLQGGEPLNQLLSTLSDWSNVESLNEILMKYP